MDPKPAITTRLPDAHGFLDKVIEQLKVLKSPQKDTLLSVLQYLSDHIRMTRNEIGALRQGDGNQQLFGNTADELEEIVTETARAANNIMDAAEMIEAELLPFCEQLERYRELGMPEQESAYCRGVIFGLYRFERESKSEFRDWSVDIPAECARDLLDQWLARNPEDSRIEAMHDGQPLLLVSPVVPEVVLQPSRKRPGHERHELGVVRQATDAIEAAVFGVLIGNA